MEFLKTNITGSPFVGIFCAVSEKFAIIPTLVNKKEEQKIEEILQVKVIKTTLANSSLLGALSVMFEDKIAVPSIVEESEKRELQKQGLEVKEIKGQAALGNLVTLNKNAGIASTLLSAKSIHDISEFFGVKILQKDVAGTNLAGSAIELTNKGFIVHPNIKAKELEGLKKTFGVHGVPTTANYGDRFIGNDVVANTKGALVGSITTSFEMIRIDEALRNE